MAKEEKKLQSFNSFNAGEYSPELAGRVDLESFGSSTRYMSNMMSQVSGGVKKFYGTVHIDEIIPTEGRGKIKLVPFINKYEPMAFVFFGVENYSTDTSGSIKIGLIHGNSYKELDIGFPSSVDVDEMRWKQINDIIIFAHKSIQPTSIKFYGKDNKGEYVFKSESVLFKEIPYFPIGETDDYVGRLEADGITGQVTLTIPQAAVGYSFRIPAPLDSQSTYTRTKYYTSDGAIDNYLNVKATVVSESTISLFRERDGADILLCNGVCNSTVKNTKGSVVDTITQEKILQVIQSVYPEAQLKDGFITFTSIDDHMDGDSYYMVLSVGRFYKGETEYYPSVVSVSAPSTPEKIDTTTLNAEGWLGRKIKFYIDDAVTVEPWWQGKDVERGDYVFSNGHWYKADNSGTTGNIQPSHTSGIRSDGKVSWLYVHSGSTTATVVDVSESSSIKVLVTEGELPANKLGDKYSFENYAWSIWGKNGVHPSDVYMAGNRLGFICNTDGYGAWNCLSVTDDYFNFSTEEKGAQLDTSAIVHLIPNNESGCINWVLSRKSVYMGSYSGEFVVKGANDILTPIGTRTDNVSNTGGKPVMPLKYKELNLFVGITGKELYTIGYDYTIDDYTPQSLGYATDHIMEKGICRIEALNNNDRNIYLLHDTKDLSLLHYVKEQKILGLSGLNAGADIVDFVTTYAKDDVVGYMATKRNDGKITFEKLATESPTYMWDTIEHKQSETKDAISVVSTDVDGTYFDPIASRLSNGLYKKGILVEGNEYQSELYELKDGTISKCERFNGAYSGVNHKVPVYVDGDIILTYAKDPSNPAGTYNKLYVSLDGGSTWNDNETPSIYYGIFTFAAVKNNIFIVAHDELDPDDGGVYVSFDYGATWVHKQELNTAQWVGFAGDMFFCLLDDGTLKYSADAETWNDCCNIEDLSSREPYIIKEIAGLYYLYSKSATTVEFLHIIKIGFGVINSVVKEGYIYPLAGNKFLLMSKTDASTLLCEYDDKTNSIIRKEATDELGDIINKGKNGLVSQKTDNVGNLFYWDNYSDVEQDKYISVLSVSEQEVTPVFCPTKHHANKEVWVKFGEDLSQFKKVTLDAEGNTTEIPGSLRYQVGLPMVCELHTQPAFGNKVEGMQQQSIAVYLRLHKSGAFYYGSSVDFDKYFEYSDWPDRQGFGEGRALYTGDCALNIPLGYAEAANQGDAKYPNSSAVGINIKCDTPEPFNLLAIQEIYK